MKLRHSGSMTRPMLQCVFWCIASFYKVQYEHIKWDMNWACKCLCFKFPRVCFCQKLAESDEIWQRYHKNKKDDVFFETQCIYVGCVCSTCLCTTACLSVRSCMTSLQPGTVQRSLLIIQHNKCLHVDLTPACWGFSTSLPQQCLSNTSIQLLQLQVSNKKQKRTCTMLAMTHFTVSFFPFVVYTPHSHITNIVKLVKFLHSCVY